MQQPRCHLNHNNIFTLKIKLLKQVNILLFFISSLFVLSCRNGTFYIDGDGINYENEITFGLVKFLDLKPTTHYEFKISTFFLITCSLLLISYLLYEFGKQSSSSTLYYLIFIASITTTYLILHYNFDYSSSFSYFSFEMNTLSLAIYFYSILLGVLSFILFFLSVIFKSKIDKQTIEDHLIE